MNFEINGLPPMCGKIAHCVGNYRQAVFNKGPIKIDRDKMLEIKKLKAQGATIKELASLYQVSYGTIENALGYRQGWGRNEI